MNTKNKIKTILIFALAMTLTTVMAQGTLVPATDVTGSHGGNYTGTLSKMIDGSGMDTTVDPLDPSTWTTSSSAYQDEWQAMSFLTGATNSKIAWCVFDLGSSTSGLQELYLWNIREGVGDRGTRTYNIYYCNSPTVSLPPAPPTNTLGSDYDFASGGWALFNTSGVLTLDQKGAAPAPADGVVSLNGISARYIGLEILTNWGSTMTRVGLAEVAFTAPDDPNLPTVVPGDSMITWSGQEVTLDTTVTNNDTTVPQGTLSYAWTADAASLADGNLTIDITNADQEDVTVNVTKTAGTDTATVVTMTLEVTLTGKDPVQTSMTIDVYDDACLAAKAIDPQAADITDFDGNCITALEDFAEIAADWLVNYEITAPVPK